MNNVVEKGNNINAITISRTFFSHLITQDMPVCPGDPQPEFKPISTIENISVVRSHAGIHVDAQKHPYHCDVCILDDEHSYRILSAFGRRYRKIFQH